MLFRWQTNLKSPRHEHRIEYLMVAQRKFDDRELNAPYRYRAKACIWGHCLGSQIISRIPQSGAILPDKGNCTGAPTLSGNSDSSTNRYLDVRYRLSAP
jgi:hypothetical protein